MVRYCEFDRFQALATKGRCDNKSDNMSIVVRYYPEYPSNPNRPDQGSSINHSRASIKPDDECARFPSKCCKNDARFAGIV
jgi:hypothetical protein